MKSITTISKFHIYISLFLFLGLIGFKPSMGFENIKSNSYSPNTYNGVDIWNEDNIDTIVANVPFFSSKCSAYEPLNFGVLVHNEHHKIYRSQALGRDGIDLLFDFLDQKQMARPTTVIFMNRHGYRYFIPPENLRTWGPKFYRVHAFAYEQELAFSQGGKYPNVSFFHPLNSNTYLSGRDPLNDLVSYPINLIADSDIAEFFQNKYPQIHEVRSLRSNFFHILNIILNANEPVLFHCTGGLHRTGMISLAIRTLQGNLWTKPFKKPLVIQTGILNHDFELRNLAELEYYLHNPYRFRRGNIYSMRELTKYQEFRNLQLKFKDQLNHMSVCK